MKLPPKPDIDLGIDGSILYTDIAAWEEWGRACAEAALKAAAKVADKLTSGNKAGGELSSGQVIAATVIADAIRSIKIEE